MLYKKLTVYSSRYTKGSQKAWRFTDSISLEMKISWFGLEMICPSGVFVSATFSSYAPTSMTFHPRIPDGVVYEGGADGRGGAGVDVLSTRATHHAELNHLCPTHVLGPYCDLLRAH